MNVTALCDSFGKQRPALIELKGWPNNKAHMLPRPHITLVGGAVKWLPRFWLLVETQRRTCNHHHPADKQALLDKGLQLRDTLLVPTSLQVGLTPVENVNNLPSTNPEGLIEMCVTRIKRIVWNYCNYIRFHMPLQKFCTKPSIYTNKSTQIWLILEYTLI